MCTCYKLIKISKELRLHSRSVASAMHQLASKQRIRGMLGYLLRVAANQQRNQWSSSGGSTTLLVEAGRLCCTEHLTNALAAESVVKLFDENPLPRPPNAFPRRDGTDGRIPVAGKLVGQDVAPQRTQKATNQQQWSFQVLINV